MTMTHQGDEGELSIFAGAEQVLIACNKGHYWLLEAAVHEVRGSDESVDSGTDLEAVLETFGSSVAGALGL